MEMGEMFEELNDMIGRVHAAKIGREGGGFAPLSEDQLQLMKRIADHSSAGTALVLALRHIEYLTELIDEDGLEAIAHDRARSIAEAALDDRMRAVCALERLVEVAKKMRTVMLGQKINNPVLDELAEIID